MKSEATRWLVLCGSDLVVYLQRSVEWREADQFRGLTKPRKPKVLETSRGPTRKLQTAGY